MQELKRAPIDLGYLKIPSGSSGPVFPRKNPS
jgi:hypothetical protein